jgi:hypothetical protein
MGNLLMTFENFPPRLKPACFGVDQVTEKLQGR